MRVTLQQLSKKSILQKGLSNELVVAAKAGDFGKVSRILSSNLRLNIDAEDGAGRTSLIWAARHGWVDILEKLIEKLSNVNHKNQFGNRALHFAAKEGHLKIVEKLIEKEADVDPANNDGETPLNWAAKQEFILSKRERVEVIELLLRKLGLSGLVELDIKN